MEKTNTNINNGNTNINNGWKSPKVYLKEKPTATKAWAAYYSRWPWRVVSTLADTKDFRSDPHWIAKKLDLSQEEAEESLQALEQLHIFNKDSNGKLVKSKSVKYGSVEEKDIMKSHMLISTEINARLLDRKKNRHGHYFISTNRKKMEECLESIRRSVKKLLDASSPEDSDEVFGLNLSCVSFINNDKTKEKTQ